VDGEAEVMAPAGRRREVTSYCRFCVASCGIKVSVDGDDVVRVRGDRDHPTSHGYTCPKGRSLPSFHVDRRRLDEPALGRSGNRRPVSWEQLTTDLADRIERILAESGPDSVGVFAGSGAGEAAAQVMTKTLLKTFGTRNLYTSLTIDGPSKSLVAALVAGQPGLAFSGIDYDNATLTLLVGTNPVVSHGQSNAVPDPRRRMRQLLDRGEVWVIDPRRTESARMATRHLAPRPGTDHIWLAAVVRDLLHTADPDLIARTTVGQDELAAAVEPYTLDFASKETGLARTDLEDLVSAIRTHGRFAGVTGTGVTMSASANLAQWLLLCLLVITDSADAPGGVWFNPGYLRRLDADDRSWGDLRASAGPAARPELPRQFGQLPAIAVVDQIEAGDLRALFVLGGNLMTCMPDTERVRRALAKIDVLFVADVVHNATTDLATHVAPCAGQLERPDVTLQVDQYLPAVVAQYTPAVVPPAKQRRELWFILAKLLEQLGHRPMPDGRAADDGRAEDLIETALRSCGVDPAEIMEAPTAVLARETAFGWVRRNVERRGGWRLAPPQLTALLAGASEPGGLQLVPRRQLKHFNSQLVETADLPSGQDQPRMLIHPADAVTSEVGEGDRVEVTSPFGSVRATAHLDPDIRPGVVSLPHGFADANVNLLTTSAEDVDPLTGMPMFTGVPVTVSKA
jgi:anaerobic selenocysteine-containing dehydrogenase